MRLRIGTLVVLLLALPGFGAIQNQNEAYLGVFETIWQKVNDTYFDPSFGGLDWQKVHDRYQPEVASASNDEGFYALINRMLWELKVSHLAFIPPGFFAAAEPVVFAAGGIGIQVRMLDGRVVIISVDPESPAQQAGLRSGFVISAIDGMPIAQVEKDVRRDRPPHNDRGRTAQVTKGIMGRIYGAPETEVSIAYLDEKGEKREKKITRAKRSGTAVGPKGMFFFALEFEARRLDNDVGYIRLNTLQPEFAAQISRAIQSMGSISGVIIDLRGNSGGEIERMPDLFLTEKTCLYLKKTRAGESKIFSDPAKDVYKGPLVVLIDVTSSSASELFAACLQASGRAVVVGDRSPGSVMESDNKIFPNGAVLMYPVAQLSTPDGTVLEGHGVIPDIEVGLKREMLLKGVDSQLESAVKYIAGIQESSAFLPRGEALKYGVQQNEDRRVVFEEIGQFSDGGTAVTVLVAGNLAYVCEFDKGLEILDVRDPRNIKKLCQVPDTEQARGIAVVGDTAFVSCNVNGLKLFDVGDSSKPVYLGSYGARDGDPHQFLAVGKIGYLTEWHGGVDIIDIADPLKPRRLSQYKDGGMAFSIQIAGPRAYVTEYKAGLKILDISNSSNPVLIGEYNNGGETNALHVAGRKAYVCDKLQGLEILDVTDPAHPVLLGTFMGGGSVVGVRLVDDCALVVNWERGLEAIDVSNPARPLRMGAFFDGGRPNGFQVVGDLVYVADGSDGLEIIRFRKDNAQISR